MPVSQDSPEEVLQRHMKARTQAAPEEEKEIQKINKNIANRMLLDSLIRTLLLVPFRFLLDAVAGFLEVLSGEKDTKRKDPYQ